MKLNNDEAPLMEQADRALDLALVGRDLEVGKTARERLLQFSIKNLEANGFAAAYNAIGDLLERDEVVSEIGRDNSHDIGMIQPDDTTETRSLTQVMQAAKLGDKAAMAELNKRMGLI